jgi:hypothetical protein
MDFLAMGFNTHLLPEEQLLNSSSMAGIAQLI